MRVARVSLRLVVALCLLRGSAATAAAAAVLFTGVFSDDRNAMAGGVAGPWAGALAPQATQWWPGLGMGQPYRDFDDSSMASASVDAAGRIFTVGTMGDVLQVAQASPSGLSALGAVQLSLYSPYAWLLRPLPLRLHTVGTSTMLFYCFFGCVRNSNPQNCSTVVMGMDVTAAPPFQPAWVLNLSFDGAKSPRSLTQMPDGTLVLLRNNQNNRTGDVATIDAQTGSVLLTVPLPIAIDACGEGAYPGVASAVAVPPSPGLPRGQLVATFAASYDTPCVYSLDLDTGGIHWAAPISAPRAPILAAAPDPQGRLPLYLLANGSAVALDALTGAQIWRTAYPQREVLTYGGALGADATQQGGAWLVVAASWGRPWAICNLYAYDAASGALRAATALPFYPDDGNGGGQVLVTPPAASAPAGLALQVYVRGTTSFASSAFDTTAGDASDLAYPSRLAVLGLACAPSPTAFPRTEGGAAAETAEAAAGCSFVAKATFDGGSAGTPVAGSLAAGPAPGQLTLVSTQGIQVLQGA